MIRVAARARSSAGPLEFIKAMLRPSSDRAVASCLALRGLGQVDALRAAADAVDGLNSDHSCCTFTSSSSATLTRRCMLPTCIVAAPAMVSVGRVGRRVLLYTRVLQTGNSAGEASDGCL